MEPARLFRFLVRVRQFTGRRYYRSLPGSVSGRFWDYVDLRMLRLLGWYPL